MNMEKLIEGLLNLATDLAIKIVTCLVVFVIGNYLIKRVVRMLDKSRLIKETEGTVRTFTASFIKIAMYVILAIIIVNIMGVPMASVITVLASAGVAVGMAMQGALGNIASGIVLMLFKPFKLGDYVSIGSVEGTVRELNLFYTIFRIFDVTGRPSPVSANCPLNKLFMSVLFPTPNLPTTIMFRFLRFLILSFMASMHSCAILSVSICIILVLSLFFFHDFRTPVIILFSVDQFRCLLVDLSGNTHHCFCQNQTCSCT